MEVIAAMASPAPVIVVEFQARGLMHCHMDVQLCEQLLDEFISYSTEYVNKR
jgi:hypothetical protein